MTQAIRGFRKIQNVLAYVNLQCAGIGASTIDRQMMLFFLDGGLTVETVNKAIHDARRKYKVRAEKIRKPANYRSLLTFENAKTTKGEALGYRTGILYLAPATEAGRANLCAGASEGCIKGCLFRAGRGGFPKNISARIRKTHFFFDQREAFLASLRFDIEKLIRRAAKLNLVPVVRVNGTSDVAWLARLMASEYPTVQFYDYTKLNRAWERTLPNYHLTFSHSEANAAECSRALQHGVNVAVVFDTKKGQPLPDMFQGARVVDGDQHDLRFLDGNQGVVIGLRAKGPAKKDCSGFVVKTAQLVQIQIAA